jgi:phosphatidylethanolamine/phosphatidyl-N-methylethanolamine N-methyltransferase
MHAILASKGVAVATLSASSVERTYKLHAPFYDIWAALAESRASARAAEWAAPQAGETILEVAVGTGRLLASLVVKPGIGSAVGLDLSRAMLRRAQARFRRPGRPAPTFCQGDALRLPFAAGTFDLLINCYMLDLMEETALPGVLAGFARVLRPGGRLVLVNMTLLGRLLNPLWMWLYGHAPTLVGGCRPVPQVERLLGEGGWQVLEHELVSQNGFRSELFLARLAPRVA